MHVSCEYRNNAGVDFIKHFFTKTKVVVANPKTSDAFIYSVTIVDSPADPDNQVLVDQVSSSLIPVNALPETRFTTAGKLFVGRIGTRGDRVGEEDRVRFYEPDGVDLIDGFDNVIPISYAPYDLRLNGTRNGPGDTFMTVTAFLFRGGSGALARLLRTRHVNRVRGGPSRFGLFWGGSSSRSSA